jgi:hypothetical protein
MFFRQLSNTRTNSTKFIFKKKDNKEKLRLYITVITIFKPNCLNFSNILFLPKNR